MTMFELPILASEEEDTDLRAARAAGWRKADLTWERLQEQGNICLEEADIDGAAHAWRKARRIALFKFAAGDPRQATTVANLAMLDRVSGKEARARKRYAKAIRKWRAAEKYIETMQIARRARSSLFHLRMEAQHWDTYQENLRTRYRAFAAETAEALEALEAGQSVPHRLFGRWRGEKPGIYDDTRKFLSAALLIGGGANQ